MPFRAHYAKKEAKQHTIAQEALAAGDLKQWHKHEAKAHRAGSHARGNGLMHTEYMTLGKENMAPGMGPMGGMGGPMGGMGGPPMMGMQQPAMGVPFMPTGAPIMTTQTSSFMLPPTTSTTIAPPIELPPQPMGMPMGMMGGVGGIVGGGVEMMAPNTIYEGGFESLEPTIIMEAAVVEEPRTIVEYGEPMPPAMMPMQMMGAPMMTAMTATAATAAFTETQYGAPQFVGENVAAMM